MLTEKEIIKTLRNALFFYLANQDAIEELNHIVEEENWLTTVDDEKCAEILNWLETKELEADVD